VLKLYTLVAYYFSDHQESNLVYNTGKNITPWTKLLRQRRVDTEGYSHCYKDGQWKYYVLFKLSQNTVQFLKFFRNCKSCNKHLTSLNICCRIC